MVWDALTGEEALPRPLKGHTEVVACVAFSPDGTRLASCVEGQHTTVAFSPDRKQLASASEDKDAPHGTRASQSVGEQNVPVRNAVTGKKAPMQPLRGHTEVVTSVAFSRDGTRQACASEGKTGHTEVVASVAFNPDGTRLVGHTEVVTGVAFSPHGTRLVRASENKTVPVRNAVTGEEAPMQPLRGHTEVVTSVAFSRAARVRHGHTEVVTSVAFSPHGTRLVRASENKTVRVRNAVTGEEAPMQPLRGHTEVVTSVAFSRDGTRQACASEGKTVRVFNAVMGGEALPRQLRRHTEVVTSVAFRRTARGWQPERHAAC
eukprot:jgi/Tetstr1/462113/TSEL_007181.t1